MTARSNAVAESFNRTVNLEWAYAQPYTSNQTRQETCQPGCTTTTTTDAILHSKGRTPMDRLLVNNLPGKHTYKGRHGPCMAIGTPRRLGWLVS